ncbi:MAG TPA: RNA polymerase sigma factor [Rhizomicrobium sp.]|nr:RNA polymerase sigma factor [Rhizomicrobium sp.]
MTQDSAEPALVARARAGSADAFGRLVHMHQQGLRAFLKRLGARDADDIAQEAFVFAWENIARFDPARPFRPWLFGIAWHKFREGKRSFLRRLMRQGRAADTEIVIRPDPGLKLDLAKALAELPPEQRATLLLCLGCEFTHAEAAEALAMPLGTVKSHVARGREKLAAALGERDG